MTVTEERPQSETELQSEPAVDHFATPGFAGALATSDHKQIGRFWILFSLIFAVLAFGAATLSALETTDISDISILDWGGSNTVQTFFQVWSLHRTSLLFFVVLPLLLGLATHVVPLQVGAPSIAFPRAAAAAFWTWLVGAGIHVTTVLIDGGLGVPNNPLTAGQGGGDAVAADFGAAKGPDVEAVELAILSMGLTIMALMLATICVVTTVVAQRPQGMNLDQVPMFSWSMLVAGAIWLLSLPVLLANLAAIWVDFTGEDVTRLGNVEDMWQQFNWVFGQPQVFAFAIPVLGIVADIVHTSSAGGRLQGRGIYLIAIGAFGALSFGAYAQPAFNPGVNTQVLFVAASFGLTLPLLAIMGGLGLGLIKGRPSGTPQFGLAMLTMSVLLLGAAAAAVRVVGPALGALREFDKDLWPTFFEEMDELNNSSISNGVMNLVLVAALAGAVAGLYHWAPKIFGRQLLTPLGGLASLAFPAGAVALGVPQVLKGFFDAGPFPFLENNYPQASADDVDFIEVMNWISTAGAAILVGGVLLVLLDVLLAMTLGRKADTEDNPWGGSTLEWATSSPPPLGNFVSAPVVSSAEPIIDLLEEGDA